MSDRFHSSSCVVRGSIMPHIVFPGETISSMKYERRAGGKGANQAVAVARAGGNVSLLGAVGSDGAWLVSNLRQAGVSVQGILTAENEPTGRAIIQLTPEGENSIILHRGANYAALPSLSVPDPQLRFTHLLLQNEIPFSSTLAFLAHSSKLGAVSVLNPSPLPAASELQQFPWDLLHWLVVNEGEAKGILSALALDEPNESEEQKSATQNDTVAHAGMLLRTLHLSFAFSPRINLVCTLGAHGLIALIPALSPSGSVDVLYLPAAHLQGPVVDTTGAGDCFTGYLIAGLMEIKCTTKEDIMAVLQRAIEAAGLCVQKLGAMESIPDKVEVDRRYPSKT